MRWAFSSLQYHDGYNDWVLILAVVALYNLASLGYIEKYKELSTFKAVGFKDKRIGQILIAQTMWITYYRSYSWSSSWWLFAWPLNGRPCWWIWYEYLFWLVSYIVGILVPLLVSAITMFLIIIRVKKLDMTSALKEKET